MSKKANRHLPLLYNIITNQGKTIPIVIPFKNFGETYFLDDGRFFDFGGIEDNDIPPGHASSHYIYEKYLNSAHILDPNTDNNWKPIRQMEKGHSKGHTVQIGSRIYVVQYITN